MDDTQILHAGRTTVEALADRLTSVLEALPTASAPVSPKWSVRDAAAHLLGVARLYAELATGVGSPYPEFTPDVLSEENAARLAGIADTDPRALARGITAAVDQFLDATTGRPGEAPVRWHADIPLRLAQHTGILVGEYLLHGYDIATAVGAPWPIASQDAALVLYGYAAILDRTVDPSASRGHTASYRLDLGPAGRLTARFTDGTLVVEPPGDEPVDCEIVADPAAMLLVSSGRLSQWPAIALGLIRAGGPRPELGLTYGRLFLTF